MISKPVVCLPSILRRGEGDCVFGNRRLFKNRYLFEESAVLLRTGKRAINVSCIKSTLEEPTLSIRRKISLNSCQKNAL